MMKFKVYIIVLIFTLSTNGIPLYLHLCSSQGLLISNSCKLCLNVENVDEPRCHSAEEEFNLNFTSHNENCCENSFIKKLDDEFISSKVENHLLSFKVLETLIILPQNLTVNYSNISHIYTDSSPPHYYKIDLNILHSSLLI